MNIFRKNVVKTIEGILKTKMRVEMNLNNHNLRPIKLISRYGIERKIGKLLDLAYPVIGKLYGEAYVTEEPNSFEQRFAGERKTLEVGKPWANKVFDSAWIHITGKVPKGAVADNFGFMIDVGGEGLVFDRDGVPMQGITTFCSQFSYELGLPRKLFVAPKGLVFGNDIDFYVDAGANDLFGNFNNRCAIGRMDIVAVCPEILGLYFDLDVLISVFDSNPKSEFTDKIYSEVCAVLAECKCGLNDVKAKALRVRVAPLLAENSEEKLSYYAMGHAHIDLAWLWPIRETIRKGGRTFATQIKNLEKYPEFLFGAGQAQLYAWIKEHYPSIYEDVKRLHKDGRWELQGAPWVESDANLVSGESLIRQMYYGKKFFKEEFGEDVKITWLPDTFGHTACLPAIMKLAGSDYFISMRMGCNVAGKLPSTFRWVGLDGESSVLAHIVPDGYYNSAATAYFLKRGERNFTEKALSNVAVNLYGIGDGGGGPGIEHYEHIRREMNMKGLPRVKPAKVIDFFKDIDNGTEYKTHEGELYLEQFRGTYTTHSKVKFYNRKIEIALSNYEFLAAMKAGEDMMLPISFERLDEIWKEALLYQFHDILPGSAINRVYEECEARYAILLKELNAGISALAGESQSGFINLNPFDVSKKVEVRGRWYEVNIPAYGYQKTELGNPIQRYCATANDNILENDCLKVSFKKGYIASIIDKKSGKEIVPCGKLLNVFTSHRDVGNCWSIFPTNYKMSKNGEAKCVAFNARANGPEAIAEIEYRIGKSIIKQTIKLIDGERTIKFLSHVCYSAKNNVLRVNFPLTINAPVAKYNIQYGHIARSTGESTALERAMFETVAHKFVDVSENGLGVSLINDSKYGFRCKGNELSMTLLRSPRGGPSTDVDQGEHDFGYELLVHDGELGEETYREAYVFNNPIMKADFGSDSISFYGTDNPAIVLDAVKVQSKERLEARFYNSTENEQVAVVAIKGLKPIAYADIMGKELKPCDGEIKLCKFGLCNVIFEKE